MEVIPSAAAALLVALLAGCDCNSSPPPPVDRSTIDMSGHDAAQPDATSRDALARDAASCATPTPFSPPYPAVAWRHGIETPLVLALGPANHRGQDVVAPVGSSPVLIGKFAYGTVDKDLKGEDVETFIQAAPPCGPWVSLGVTVTSEEGQYGTQYGIQDDGGRVFLKVPATYTAAPGRYPVRMLVKGDLTVAKLALVVVAAGTTTAVFDIDGTLTTDDFQLVSQLFSNLLAGTYVPKMYADADKIVKTWASKGYQIVYLTGRPDTLRGITQGWLVDKGFPPGAVHLTDTALQALPISAGVAAYKTDFLKRLSSEGKLSLHAAYGNAATDIEAYAAGGVPLARTFIIGAQGGKQGTVAVTDYPTHLPAAAAMPAAATPAPPALAGW